MKSHPPKIALRFFRWYCNPRLQDYIEGDLMEVYNRRLKTSGKRIANFRFAIDVLLLCRPAIIKSAEGLQQLNHYGMYKSYFKIGWRNLKRHKIYSAVNMASLSIGFTVFILVLLYANYERSYDRWIPNLNQVYRVGVSEQNEDGLEKSPSVQYPLGTFLSEECPEVDFISRVRIPYGESIVATNQFEFFENKVIHADSNFFRIFPYEFIHGDIHTALQQPNTVVITREIGEKWFGQENPIGKVIKYNTRVLYTITGVIEKQGPSHLDFDICLSYHDNHFANNWFMRNHDTYVMLHPGASISSLQQKATAIYATHYAASHTNGSGGTTVETNNPVQWLAEKRGITNLSVFFEPVSDIHLQPQGFMEWSAGNAVYDFNLSNELPLLVFSLIGILILLLACVNYTNMAVAQGLERAKESGIRKVMGASKAQLIRQQFIEAFILCVISAIISLVLIQLSVSVLNSTFHLHLTLWNDFYSDQNYEFVTQFIIIVLMVTLLASVYPAFVLANYQPIKVLKGNIAKTIKGKWLRNGLVTFQYSIAVGFIIGIFIITLQLNYMQKNDPGFNTEQVLRIEQKTVQLFPGQPDDRSDYVISSLLQIPGVKQVTTGEIYPGMRERGVQIATYDNNQSLPIQFSLVNYDYFDVLGMKILKGRDFSREFGRDSVDAAVINETAAQKMGWQNPIGKTLKLMAHEYTIIGVVKDSHLSGYENKVLPQIYMMGVDEPDNFSGHDQVLIKFEKQAAQATMLRVVDFWKHMEPEFPVKYSWLDQDFAKLMEKHERFGKLTVLLALSSLLIAVMGVFTLSAFTAQQRTKEIGIRKVLGASVTNIVTMLSSDFLLIASISTVTVLPVVIWAMNKWLETFAYKIELTWWMFAIPATIGILFALITVSFESIKAALANPVKSLRSE